MTDTTKKTAFSSKAVPTRRNFLLLTATALWPFISSINPAPDILAWAAEPEMEARKKIGWKMLIMLSVLAVMLYILKKAIWRRIK